MRGFRLSSLLTILAVVVVDVGGTVAGELSAADKSLQFEAAFQGEFFFREKKNDTFTHTIKKMDETIKNNLTFYRAYNVKDRPVDGLSIIIVCLHFGRDGKFNDDGKKKEKKNNIFFYIFRRPGRNAICTFVLTNDYPVVVWFEQENDKGKPPPPHALA